MKVKITNTHKFVEKIVAFCLVASIFVGMNISVYAVGEKNVTINVDGEVINITTDAVTVGEALGEAGVVLARGERAVPSVKSALIGDTEVTVYREISVIVLDGKESTNYMTSAPTVGEFMSEVKYDTDEFDTVMPDADSEIYAGMYIVVTRAVPFTYIDGGEEKTLYTAYETVGEALKQNKIRLDGDDYTIPASDAKFTANMTIERVNVEIIEEEKRVEVNYATETVENDALEEGISNIVQEGRNGSAIQTVAVRYENGEAVSETVVSQTYIVEPVSEIVEIGTYSGPKKINGGGVPNSYDPNVVCTGDGETFRYTRVIECVATAYDASPASNGKWAGMTATGLPLEPGMIAVDPKVIPLHSKLFIEASDGTTWVYGYGVAGDTGGAIKGNRVDLFYSTASEARNFGRRSCKVYILE